MTDICVRDCTLMIKTVPEYEIYHFNHYDAGGEEWSTNPEYMIDISITTQAEETVNAVVQHCDYTSYTSSDEFYRYRVFDKIEFRVFAFYDAGTACDVKCRPVFSAGDGSNYQYSINSTYANAEWTIWEDITSDTNAPSEWTENDIINLGMDVERAGAGNGTCKVGKIEVRVQWHYEIPIIYPHREGAEGKLNKILTLFNFWTDDYDIIDEGMNDDGLTLRGLDIMCEDVEPECFSFPACFPWCANIGSTAQFHKKWHMLEVLANTGITIEFDTLDKTLDGTFVIKSINLSSVNNERAYMYNIILKRKTYGD
ncbi:hypothetical protein KAX02_01520 [candidate division WOR-3 bacterium]|nr:hypothetical protein [candidate division WOR-3 bacterium]